MKGFLFDENLPRRVRFTTRLPCLGALAVASPRTDTALWEYARKKDLLVTKDADFSHRMMMTSPSPWLVHLRFGNLRRKEYHVLLAAIWPRIEAMLPGYKLINVYADRMEAVKD